MVERGTGESLDHVAERAEEVLARGSSYAGHRGLEGRELGLDTEEDERQEEEEEEEEEEESICHLSLNLWLHDDMVG